MSLFKTADLTGDVRSPPAQRALPSMALAVLAALLPLLLMLLAAFAGPRFFAAWTVQIPFTADFGAAGIIGVAIICAALLVGYVQLRSARALPIPNSGAGRLMPGPSGSSRMNG
jgi:hypothetical protein